MNNQNAERWQDSFPLQPVLAIAGVLLVVFVLFILGPGSIPTPPEETAPAEAVVLTPTVEPTLEPTAEPTLEPTGEPVAVAAALDPVAIEAGRMSYQFTCVACHGLDARGMPGLGKDLTNSDFVRGLNDEELLAFIREGRSPFDPANTTGVEMPPSGGNPSLTDGELANIIVYLRSLDLQGTTAAAAVPPEPTVAPTTESVEQADTVPTPTVVPTQVAAAPETEADSAAVPEREIPLDGPAVYAQSCVGCHGANGEGVAYLSASLSESTLLAANDTDALVTFLTEGRPLADPREEAGHPYRGGYPQLTDEQIANVAGYIRSFSVQPLDGPAIYTQSCVGCHGVNGEGVAYLSAPLSESALLAAGDADGLVTFLTEGRPLADPREEAGHPYRGGYPMLSDGQIARLVDYLLQSADQ